MVKKNGNKEYSQKIFKKLSKSTNLLKYYPEIGRVYSELNVRFLVIDNFQIFYDFNESEIQILHIWDSKKEKSNLKF